MKRAGGALAIAVMAIAPAACQLLLDADPTASSRSDAGASADAAVTADADVDAPPDLRGHGPVETVAGTYPGVSAVALSKTTLYWSATDPDSGTAGAIWAMSRDGGSPVRLETEASNVPVDLVTRFDGVVYGGGTGGVCALAFMHAAPLSPAQQVAAFTQCFHPARIAGTGSTLVAVGKRDSVAAVIVSEGATARELISTVGPSYDTVAVAPDGTIYFSRVLGAVVDIARADTDDAGTGTGVSLVTVTERSVTDLETDGTALYWTTTSPNAVHRASADGGSPVSFPIAAGVPTRLAVSNGAMYVTANANSGHIVRADEQGTTAFVDVDGQPFDIAVDDTLVVWSNPEKQTVEMVHRR